ncbi:hypothetical protein D6745_03210 [Candidatus Woesearchaeota archaeon]|nr:MAG: hypothetical protein D6745_03210 [Candidatus Woesearchaeota archaeon]
MNEEDIDLIQAYKTVFSSPEGKKVLSHLMRSHGFYSTSFVEGDMFATAFNEGGRNVVMQILKKININLDELEKQILEGESLYVW